MTFPFTTSVSGISFRQEAAAHVQIGEQVIVRRQPENPHDPNAIAIYTLQGQQLGYIPAKVAARISGEWLQGTVTEVYHGKTIGLRVKIVQNKEHANMETILVPCDTEPQTAPDMRQNVHAKSGRLLGKFKTFEDDRVIVETLTGTEVKYPRSVVQIERA